MLILGRKVSTPAAGLTAGHNKGDVIVTTTDAAAAAWHGHKRLALAALLMVGLAGCETSTNLLGSSSAPNASIAPAPQQAQPQPVSQSKVALAPIVGAPDAVNKQISSQLTTSLAQQRVLVASGADRADYTLRGYMVAAKEKQGVKVSYIWDLTDPAGKRANRIQGEELVSGGDGRDPWSAVSPQLVQTISDKTATSLASALSSLTQSSAGPSAPVGVGAPVETGSTTSAAQPGGSTTTASVARPGTSLAKIGGVTGAPGDGNAALAGAMRQELQTAGVSLGDATQRGYTVNGKVAMGAARNGKQTIKIDWTVLDPNGSTLAVVTQNNEVDAGSLDGAWGATANDAAQGAAAKIKTLIDESRTGVSSTGPVLRKAAQKTKT